jgi:hypothetical protein
MKHYITVRQNDKQLIGSDFTIIINSNLNYLGAGNIRKYFEAMQKRIDNLKTIKPFLNNGGLTIHYER